MKALITGATSGLGKELANILSKEGYDLILTGRDKYELSKLKSELPCKVQTYNLDLLNERNVYYLFNKTKSEKIDLLINSAGMGGLGEFTSIDLEKDLDIINLNIKALHILTKLFLQDMEERNSGTILNISSSACFSPGPLMATYYASKSYVYSLSMALSEEEKRKKSNVKICVAVPGAFKSNFLKRANIKKATYVKDTSFIAGYIYKSLKRNKTLIVPGFFMKLVIFIIPFIPKKLLLKINYNLQNKKR